LTLALHPHVKEVLKPEDNQVVTPFSLHYGTRPQRHPTVLLENELTPEQRGAYRLRWQQIIKHYDTALEKELQERIKSFHGTELQLGDLVFVKNMIGHKEQLKYYKNIYEIIKIEKSRFYVTPLFSGGRIMEVNGNNLKPYAYSELYDLLPNEIKQLMGENLSPDEIKARQKQNPSDPPLDFTDWRFWRMPQPMALRQRLTPARAESIPALKIHDSELSDSTDRSSSVFTVPSSIPDFISEATTLLDPKSIIGLGELGQGLTPTSIVGVSQLKSTNKGVETTPYKLTPKELKSKSIYLRSFNEKDLLNTKLKEQKESKLQSQLSLEKQKMATVTKEPAKKEERIGPKTLYKPPAELTVPELVMPFKGFTPRPKTPMKRVYSDDKIKPYEPTSIEVIEEGPQGPPPKSILKKVEPEVQIQGPTTVARRLDFSDDESEQKEISSTLGEPVSILSPVAEDHAPSPVREERQGTADPVKRPTEDVAFPTPPVVKSPAVDRAEVPVAPPEVKEGAQGVPLASPTDIVVAVSKPKKTKTKNSSPVITAAALRPRRVIQKPARFRDPDFTYPEP